MAKKYYIIGAKGLKKKRVVVTSVPKNKISKLKGVVSIKEVTRQTALKHRRKSLKKGRREYYSSQYGHQTRGFLID